MDVTTSINDCMKDYGESHNTSQFDVFTNFFYKQDEWPKSGVQIFVFAT